MKADREIIRSANFAAEAADFIIEHAHKALGERNEFRIALSGGNTPRPVYAQLATCRARPAMGTLSNHFRRRALRPAG